MRVVLAALALLTLTGGVRKTPSVAVESGPTWYFLGDTHFGTPTGDGVLGRDRLRKVVALINADPQARFLVIGGDMEYDGGTTDDFRDSLTVLLNETLQVPCFPVVGNHDETDGDTTPNLFDHLINRFPGMFASYESASQRGRRWWHQYHPGGAPVSLFAVQNNRTNAAGDYDTENPATGGVAVDDFDGISDSTSTQRADLKTAMLGLGYNDWPIVAGHRTAHGMADVSLRPDIEGINSGDADSSYVEWMDTRLDGRKWILLEADQHENKALSQIGNHYTFSACMRSRDTDPDKFALWSSYITSFAMQDTSISSAGGALDSLGVNGDGQDHEGDAGTGFNGWNILWKFEHISAGRIKARMLLIQNFDATAAIDSVTINLR